MSRLPDKVLNSYFGRRLSDLTECTAPDLPQGPDLFFIYALKEGNALEEDKPAAFLVLFGNFVRNLETAQEEYRNAIRQLRLYVSALPDSTLVMLHTGAVASFEHCILKAWLAYRCYMAVLRVLPGLSPPPKPPDGHLIDRMEKLNNRIKHFDDDVAGKMTLPGQSRSARPVDYPLAPIWLKNTGITCREGSITYTELAGFLALMAQRALRIVLPRPEDADLPNPGWPL